MTESPALSGLVGAEQRRCLGLVVDCLQRIHRQGTTYPGLLADRSAAAASSPKPSSAFGALAGPAATKPAFGGATSLGRPRRPGPMPRPLLHPPRRRPSVQLRLAVQPLRARQSSEPRRSVLRRSESHRLLQPSASLQRLVSGFRSSPWTAGSAGSAAPCLWPVLHLPAGYSIGEPRFANATTSPSGGLPGLRTRAGLPPWAQTLPAVAVSLVRPSHPGLSHRPRKKCLWIPTRPSPPSRKMKESPALPTLGPRHSSLEQHSRRTPRVLMTMRSPQRLGNLSSVTLASPSEGRPAPRLRMRIWMPRLR